MIYCHSVIAKLSDFYLVKLKFAVKNATGVTQKFSSSMINTDETNFSYNILLIDRQVVSLPKIFTNTLSKCFKIAKDLINQNDKFRWISWIINESWVGIDEKCAHTFGKKSDDITKINSSSFNS